MTWGLPTLAGGKGCACRCAPDETHGESAKDINRTHGRRIGFSNE